MDKWDRRYATAETPPPPAAIVVRNDHLLPTRGLALDLACGLGGNALFLARHGLTVEAWDASRVALERLSQWAGETGLAVHPRRVDLTREVPPPDRYDVIVVAHFLHRPLLGAIRSALAKGGVLFYQTFTQAAPHWSRGPRNPAMRLTRGELLRAFAGLEVLFYQEEADVGDFHRGERELARLVARRCL